MSNQNGRSWPWLVLFKDQQTGNCCVIGPSDAQQEESVTSKSAVIRIGLLAGIGLLARIGLLAAVATVAVDGLSWAAGSETGAVASAAEAALMPYYDFHSPNPRGGFCEQQIFGRGPMVAEPINVAFSVPTIILGLIGLFRSKRTAMGFQFLFGLLASYGVFNMLYHVSLMNGLYRMQDVAVSLVQSFVIVMLVHALYLFRVKRARRQSSRAYRVVAVAMTLIFTAYPAAVHVAGESSANPWVAWLVFDVLWSLVGALLILIWRRRAAWPRASAHGEGFRLALYAIPFALVAYVGWSVDRFLCCPMVARLCLHGLWDLFMGLCLYCLISFARFLSAHEFGFEPTIEYIPSRGRVRLPFVEWKSRAKA